MNHAHWSRKTKRGGPHRHNLLSAAFIRSAQPGRPADGNGLDIYIRSGGSSLLS